MEAAYALFSERGFAATTMDEIAERAGVSRRTAFRYFPTKESLVFPEREERFARFSELLRPEPGESGFSTVRRACLALAGDYEADRARTVAQWAIVREDTTLLGRELQLDRDFEDAIRATLARDVARSARGDRQARIRAGAVLGAIRATMRVWLESERPIGLLELGGEAFEELEAGIRGT